MKILRNPIFMFLLGGIIFLSISAYAEYIVTADKIEYSANVSVKDKIDDLYTTATTTLSNKNQQIAALTSDKSSLQAQLDSITSERDDLQNQVNNPPVQTSSFSFVSSTTKQTFNLGFQPKYIYCLTLLTSTNSYQSIIYNYDYSQNYVYKWDAISSQQPESVQRDLAVFYTINSNGFSWNITNWNGYRVYCTAAK